jgi:hypothetical protein
MLWPHLECTTAPIKSVAALYTRNTPILTWIVLYGPVKPA